MILFKNMIGRGSNVDHGASQGITLRGGRRGGGSGWLHDSFYTQADDLLDLLRPYFI